MKVIKENSITSIATTSENPLYPVSNLLNEHPKKWWRVVDSTVNNVLVTAFVNGYVNSLGLVGIVAEDVKIEVRDPRSLEWDNVVWQNVDWQGEAVNVVQEKSFPDDTGSFAIWMDFDDFNDDVEVSILLSKSSNTSDITLGAGCLVVGEYVCIPGLQKGLREGLKDYSLHRELSNGARYYKKRDIVRTFSGTAILNRTPYFYDFVLDIARTYGQKPLMWNLVTADQWGGEAVIYGVLNTPPEGSHRYFDKSVITFEIEEVL